MKVHRCGWNVLRWKLYALVAVCGLCGCGCLQACTTTLNRLCGCGCLQACTTKLNQFSVMGGGGEGGRRAVDNGWEGDQLSYETRVMHL